MKWSKPDNKVFLKLKKVFKWYFLVSSLIILIIILAFLIWFIKPTKTLDIAILDKTTPATSADGESYLGDVENNYRKHLGSNWIADYLKIKNPETDELYDYTTGRVKITTMGVLLCQGNTDI